MQVRRVFMDLKNHRAIESLRDGRSGDDRKFGQLGSLCKCRGETMQLSGVSMSPTVWNKPL